MGTQLLIDSQYKGGYFRRMVSEDLDADDAVRPRTAGGSGRRAADISEAPPRNGGVGNVHQHLPTAFES
jgi:hypothetical protein